mmetsp:Transcript_1316/g.3483  ORF Transcript_1316/g.3483 Transcript_1316/m.3483 type:complete len:379 (+) Transcript_1316:667-1803(+)
MSATTRSKILKGLSARLSLLERKVRFSYARRPVMDRRRLRWRPAGRCLTCGSSYPGLPISGGRRGTRTPSAIAEADGRKIKRRIKRLGRRSRKRPKRRKFPRRSRSTTRRTKTRKENGKRSGASLRRGKKIRPRRRTRKRARRKIRAGGARTRKEKTSAREKRPRSLLPISLHRSRRLKLPQSRPEQLPKKLQQSRQGRAASDEVEALRAAAVVATAAVAGGRSGSGGDAVAVAEVEVGAHPGAIPVEAARAARAEAERRPPQQATAAGVATRAQAPARPRSRRQAARRAGAGARLRARQDRDGRSGATRARMTLAEPQPRRPSKPAGSRARILLPASLTTSTGPPARRVGTRRNLDRKALREARALRARSAHRARRC